MLNDFSLRD